jgi:hypothetical protein
MGGKAVLGVFLMGVHSFDRATSKQVDSTTAIVVKTKTT